MHSDIFDYRNGKYQGPVNSIKQRQGLGIFIDDDLSFYVSHWQENKLQGATLAYLTHGKYIYGEWKNNQPHGLNVFRSGDTVLVGKFAYGTPIGRCLLIFERYNFACILSENNGQWDIAESGQLLTHRSLLQYIYGLGFSVPDHYFSLTKFACAYSNNNGYIKTYPCLVSCCYFGFINGLAIIFNSNNGVVSIGHHMNQQVCEFGGKFEGVHSVEEGNFQSEGETISYKGNRPSQRIHSIFQKLHKRSLNFSNQYFDSRFRIFSIIEDLVRGKLKDIGEECRKYQGAADLNDSLDYQQYGEEESLKINDIREKMYSPPKKTMDREKERIKTPMKSSVRQDDSQNQNSKNRPKYFKKNTQSSQKQVPQSKSKNISYIEKSDNKNNESHQQEQKPYVYQIRRSPIKYQNRISTSNLKKKENNCIVAETSKINKIISKNQLNLNKPKKATLPGQQQSEREEKIFKNKQQSQIADVFKLKERMRSNNLKYINNTTNISNANQQYNQQTFQQSYIPTYSRDSKGQSTNFKLNQIMPKQQIQVKAVPHNKIKGNNYIPEQEQKIIGYRVLKTQQQIDSFRVPTFKGLIDQYQKSKKKSNYNNLEETSSFQNIKFNQQGKLNQSNKKEAHKQKQDFSKSKKGFTPKRKNHFQEEDNQQDRTTLQNERRKKSIQVANLARPSYEDIEERRKRILRQFKDINEPKTISQTKINNSSSKPNYDNNSELQYKVQNSYDKRQQKTDSLQSNQQISASKSQQSSFGYIPLSISNKINQRDQTPNKRPPIQRQNKKQTEIDYSQNISNSFTKKQQSQRKAFINDDNRECKQNTGNTNQQLRKKASHSYINMNQKKNQDNQNIMQTTDQKSNVSIQSSLNVTPSRQKRSYQYMYE